MEIKCKYDNLMLLSDLKENPKNPNKHSNEQLNRLIKIFECYGIRHPIIVSNQSGLIVVGHGRKKAAEKLNLDKFPVVYQDFKNEDEEYGFVVADNGIASWADLDLKLINLEISCLGPDFDIDLLGLNNFVIEPAEKLSKEKKEKVCPHCGGII